MEYSYDFWLVLLSFIMAVIASFSALGLASRIPFIEKEKVHSWLAGGAFAMGTGIWAMHFIGMLAFHLPVQLAYDPILTVISVFIAIVSSAIALFIIRNGVTTKAMLYASSVLMGLGIAAMHYTGMAAIIIEPPISYDSITVVISIIIAIFASYFALNFTFQSNISMPMLFTRKNLFAAIIMGIAIAGMHYTGMAAAHFHPGSSSASHAHGIMDSRTLAIIVTVATLFIIAISVVLLSFEIRMAEHNAIRVEELHRYNEELEERAEELAYSMTEQILENSRRDKLLAKIVNQSSEAIITTDVENKITSWNKAAENIFEYSQDEVIGKNINIIDARDTTETCHPVVKSKEMLGDGIFIKKYTKTKKIVYIDITSAPMNDDDDYLVGYIYTFKDVTRNRESHQQIMLWSSVYTNSSEGIIITDSENKIISINQAFTTITGYSEAEVKGKSPAILSSGLHNAEFYQALWNSIHQIGSWKGEIWNKRKNGEIYPEWLTITTLHDSESKICNHIAIFTDITSFKEKEERIQYLAYHDKLTGLPNRSLMEDRLEQAISHAERHNNKVGVIFLDLDRFKNINDSLGHTIGDLLLIETSRRLKSCLRQDDTVSRQGGDEFIIIIKDIDDLEVLAHLSEKILASIAKEYVIENEKIMITSSLGISVFPDDAKTADDLIKNADAAMYHAKAKGRANYQFYTSSLNESIHNRIQMEHDLENAFERDEFELFFQPEIQLSNKIIFGAEVLIRWNHPDKGMILPNDFIPIAEESGKIVRLGNWVLEKAVKQASEWLEKYPRFNIRYSVNISPRQLENTAVLLEIERLLREHDFPSKNLAVEITETTLMRNVVTSYEILNRLKELDIKVYVDDFGTGYSSLNYLKRLPIDSLKIDREFIKDVPDDINDASIVKAIISLSKDLGLSIIAEGIENKKQEDFLLNAGCMNVQGFYYCKPLPADEFIKYLISMNMKA